MSKTRESVCTSIFAVIDTDHDGKLSFAEIRSLFVADAQEEVKRRVKTAENV
jgi:Ca2+-binding EF-hand superfamily protein